MADSPTCEARRLTRQWLPLAQLLLAPNPSRLVALQPALNHAELCQRALRLAGQWQAHNIQRIALYLEDAGELAIALLAAWQAKIDVVLPGDAQPQTRERLAGLVDCWLDHLDEQVDATPLAPRSIDLDQCALTLSTSGSSGEPKLIEKTLRQLHNEVQALEHLWGAQLGDSSVIGSVAAQHIYGLLFRVLWPLCAGRPFVRRAQPFPEDMQLASLAQPAFSWIASPALLKRMGDNLDWPALRAVRQIFSSGGALPTAAAEQLHARLGQWPTEVYGSSETGGIGWRQGGQRWQPFTQVQLSLDPHGALQLYSPYLAQGEQAQTADAAELHDDGRFSLGNRLDRIVKLEEKRIALPALENVLNSHPWVSDCRFGVIQQGRAFLGALLALSPAGLHTLRNSGRRHLTETLRAELRNHCEAIALPRRWRLLSQLPYNAQGKLPQAAVEALLRADRPRHVQPLSAQEHNGEWHLELEVPLDLAHFTGHFPQTPVLPGVVQVDWAQQLARQYIANLPPRFAGMEVLKFQQLARPGDRLHLTLRFDAERGKLYFNYRHGDAACSSGRILLQAAHD